MPKIVSHKDTVEATASQAPKMGRRTFLRTLSGGALVLTAGGFLAGCGGSSNNTSASTPAPLVVPAQQFALTFPGGQVGNLAFTSVSGNSVSGTLTITQIDARPRTGFLFAAGVYSVTGTLSPLNLTVTPESGNTNGTVFTLTGTLPASGDTGSVTATSDGETFTVTATGTAPSSGAFTASTSGDVNSANGNGAQPFQIGPTVGTVGSTDAALNSGNAGSFTVTSTNNPGGLPTQELNFTLYASTVTPVSGSTTQVTYSGTYAIYQDTSSILSQGTFTSTATFTGTQGLTANLTGTFTPTAGDTAYGTLNFTGTFSSTSPGVGQTITTTLTSA